MFQQRQQPIKNEVLTFTRDLTVKDYTGQRTNLFTLAVAPSSGGKNDPISFGQKLIHVLRGDKRVASKVTSDSALEILLSDFPVRCMFLDEVGDYLGSMKAAGTSNPYLQTVIPCLKELWSKANGTYTGKARAADSNGKWKPPKQIQGPHVSIYGTGAPSRLFESMTERDLDDGSIPRFIVFFGDKPGPRRDVPDCDVPEDLRAKLLDALTALGIPEDGTKELKPDGTSVISDTPTPFTVEYTENAKAAFNAFEDFKYNQISNAEDDPYLYLWGKAVENARRVALVVSVFRSPHAPTVDQTDADYAISLMKHAVGDMIECCRQNVASTEQERGAKTLERIIRKNGRISQGELTRKTQSMKRSLRLDALDDLIDAGIIKSDKEDGKGKKRITYYSYIGD